VLADIIGPATLNVMEKKYNELTPKQSEVLQVLREHFSHSTESPTVEELRELIGVKYKRSVIQFLNALEEKAYINRTPNTSRGISMLNQIEDSPDFITVPVKGSAGCDNAMIFAQETFDESIIVDKKLFAPSVSEIIAIKAIGHSMQSAGISDGDHVLVEMTDNIESGDRVVAIVGDTAVIKRIKFNHNSVVLNPDSPDGQYKPIVLKERPIIVGKVLIVIDTQPDDVEYFYDTDKVANR
jgi:repressor LexA